MQLSPQLKLRDLEGALWQTALETIGTTEIESACALSLRAWMLVHRLADTGDVNAPPARRSEPDQR
jgi:hypothetical protein